MRATENSASSYVTVKNGSTSIDLQVVDMRDDDQTLVFNASTDKVAAIEDDTEYDIVGFVGITDLAGNIPDYEDGDDDFSTDDDAWDVTDKDDAMRADSLSQDTGNTVDVTFDGPIKVTTMTGGAITETGETGATVVWIPSDDDDSGSDADNMMAFTMEVIGDDDDTIRFTKTSGSFPEDSVELQFNFTRMSVSDDITAEDMKDTNEQTTDIKVVDILNRDSYDEVNDIDVDNDDDTEPVLDDIVVIDKKTIHLYFSEKLKTTGSYEITYEDKDDDDEEKKISSSKISVSFDDDDIADIVELKLLSDDLKDQEYELHYKTSPKDLANNSVEDDDDTISFTGVATDVAIDMVAAKVEGALNLKMINDYEDFPANAFFRFTGTGSNDFDIQLSGTAADDELDLIVKPYYALLNEYIDANGNSKAVTYTFKYGTSASDLSTYTTQSFRGTLDEDKATVTTTFAASSLHAIQFTAGDLDIDNSNYAFYLVDPNTAALTNASKLTVIDKNDFTYDANDLVNGFANSNVADMTIAEGENGDVIVVTDGFTGNYKVISVPLSNDVPTGAIEVITQAISY